MSPRLSSPAHPGSGGGPTGGGTPGRGRGGGGAAGYTKRDREIIGQTVRIIQGPFKGKLKDIKGLVMIGLKKYARLHDFRKNECVRYVNW